MIKAFALEEGQIELIGDEPGCDMLRESWVSFNWRQSARPAALVSHWKRLADAKSEMRIVVKEKGSNVVVIDQKQNIRFLFFEPAAHRRIPFKNRGPVGIGLFIRVQGEPDGGGVRTGNCAYDRGHNTTPAKNCI